MTSGTEPPMGPQAGRRGSSLLCCISAPQPREHIGQATGPQEVPALKPRVGNTGTRGSYPCLTLEKWKWLLATREKWTLPGEHEATGPGENSQVTSQ